MKNRYPQKNLLWCYSFVTKELFTLPASDAELPDQPVFLFDSYDEFKLKELSQTHLIHAISFYSCEDEETLRGYLEGVLPEYYMYKIYSRWRRCVIVFEGTDNIYCDAKNLWRSWETPGDVLIRMSYSGRLIRTQKEKVKPYDPLVCTS